MIFSAVKSGGPTFRNRVAQSEDTGGPCLSSRQTPSTAAGFKPLLLPQLQVILILPTPPGNVMLPARSSGLPRDSVVNVSQVLRANRRPASRDPCKRADSVPACSVRKLRSRVCDAQERCSGQSWDTLAPATTARKTSGSDALLKDPSRDFVKLPRVCSTSKSADRARHWTQTQVVGAISVHPPHKEGMH